MTLSIKIYLEANTDKVLIQDDFNITFNNEFHTCRLKKAKNRVASLVSRKRHEQKKLDYKIVTSTYAGTRDNASEEKIIFVNFSPDKSISFNPCIIQHGHKNTSFLLTSLFVIIFLFILNYNELLFQHTVVKYL